MEQIFAAEKIFNKIRTQVKLFRWLKMNMHDYNKYPTVVSSDLTAGQPFIVDGP